MSRWLERSMNRSCRMVVKNAIFLYLSVFSCMGPMLLVSYFSYEFGSLIGMSLAAMAQER